MTDPQSLSQMNPCCLLQWGQVNYPKAWAYQRHWVNAKKRDSTIDDCLILLEHDPVYTLGTGSSESFLKFSPDKPPAPLLRTERGGEVTYHCPGQLVGYPILDLQHFQPDLHWYLRQLETVLINTVKRFELQAETIPGLTGVWLEGKKIAAIAIKVSRWISFHGFALNVNPDLTGFEAIVPCGIEDRPVGSLAQWCPGITRAQVESVLINCFAEQFGIQWQTTPPPLGYLNEFGDSQG